MTNSQIKKALETLKAKKLIGLDERYDLEEKAEKNWIKSIASGKSESYRNEAWNLYQAAVKFRNQ